MAMIPEICLETKLQVTAREFAGALIRKGAIKRSRGNTGREKFPRKGGAEKMLTHAGGLVFRHRGGEVHYLIVRAKPNPSHWVIPKGHIEPGESPEAAARREIWEETGVQAKIIAPLGTSSFIYQGKEIHTMYYLLEYQGETAPQEERESHWGPLEETLTLLTFADTREKLCLAEEIVLKKNEG
jgi:8-oxo-dGTP pyrophosphatase MutT (NUDIX family)